MKADDVGGNKKKRDNVCVFPPVDSFPFTLLTIFVQIDILFSLIRFILSSQMSSRPLMTMCVAPNVLYTRIVFEIYTFISICMRWNVWLHLFIYLFIFSCIFLPLGLNKNISLYQKVPTRLTKYFKYFQRTEEGHNASFFFWPLPMLCRQICVHKFSNWPFSPESYQTLKHFHLAKHSMRMEIRSGYQKFLELYFFCKKFMHSHTKVSISSFCIRRLFSFHLLSLVLLLGLLFLSFSEGFSTLHYC